MSVKSCVGTGYDVQGDTVGIVYPQYGIARIRTVAQNCPLKMTQAIEKPISEMAGWCVIPPEQCAQYSRDYETLVCN